MAAHRVVLAIAPLPLAVLVALVAGDDEDDADVAPRRGGVEDVHGAHHVRRVGLDRVGVGAAHERLRGHVEDDLGPGLRERRRDGRQVADVALVGSPRHRRTRARSNSRGPVRWGRRARSRTRRRPAACSQSASQAPLKPVCPVTSTRLPLQKPWSNPLMVRDASGRPGTLRQAGSGDPERGVPMMQRRIRRLATEGARPGIGVSPIRDADTRGSSATLGPGAR